MSYVSTGLIAALAVVALNWLLRRVVRVWRRTEWGTVVALSVLVVDAAIQWALEPVPCLYYALGVPLATAPREIAGRIAASHTAGLETGGLMTWISQLGSQAGKIYSITGPVGQFCDWCTVDEEHVLRHYVLYAGSRALLKHSINLAAVSLAAHTSKHVRAWRVDLVLAVVALAAADAYSMYHTIDFAPHLRTQLFIGPLLAAALVFCQATFFTSSNPESARVAEVADISSRLEESIATIAASKLVMQTIHGSDQFYMQSQVYWQSQHASVTSGANQNRFETQIESENVIRSVVSRDGAKLAFSVAPHQVAQAAAGLR